MDFNIAQEQKGDVLVLNLLGKLDTNNANDFQTKFNEVAQSKTKNVILNCEDLDFVASSGLRVFLMFLKHLKKIGGQLVMCGLNETISEVFDVSGFLPIFTITDDMEEAMQEFD